MLNSLSTFLQEALSTSYSSGTASRDFAPDDVTFPTWYFEHSFDTLEAFKSYNLLFQHHDHSIRGDTWKPEIDAESFDEDFICQDTFMSDIAPEWNLDNLIDVTRALEIEEGIPTDSSTDSSSNEVSVLC